MVALLSLVTLGIYTVIWYFNINNELAKLGELRNAPQLGTTPTKSALALFPGGLLIVPAVISIYRTGQRINEAQHMTGERVGFSAVLGVILWILFPVGAAFMQASLNKAWRNQERAAT